jgi:hypothetical protein
MCGVVAHPRRHGPAGAWSSVDACVGGSTNRSDIRDGFAVDPSISSGGSEVSTGPTSRQAKKNGSDAAGGCTTTRRPVRPTGM